MANFYSFFLHLYYLCKIAYATWAKYTLSLHCKNIGNKVNSLILEIKNLLHKLVKMPPSFYCNWWLYDLHSTNYTKDNVKVTNVKQLHTPRLRNDNQFLLHRYYMFLCGKIILKRTYMLCLALTHNIKEVITYIEYSDIDN